MLLIAILVLNILVIILFAVYCRLTCGICKCSKHLVGKVVIVTGGNAGIGYETAKNLAERGAKVILACRNDDRGITARDKIIEETGNKDVHYRQLDLASLKSVRKFAEDVIKNEKHLDILINNAGIAESTNVKTEDGLLLAMQTNHFGPFLLTCLLLPLLKTSAPSRIINVSSLAHERGVIDFCNLNMENVPASGFDFLRVYQNSKLCNNLMTVELARVLKDSGVTANCLHPGVVETDILLFKSLSLMKFVMLLLKQFSKTPWEGAQTTIYLAVSPEVNEISGAYFIDCRERKPSKLAQDKELARKLWEVSERLVNP